MDSLVPHVGLALLKSVGLAQPIPRLHGCVCTCRYAFEWDATTKFLLSAQSTVTSLGTSYLNLSCLTNSNSNVFVAETMLYGVAPAVLCLVAFLGSWVSWRRAARGEDTAKVWEKAKTSALGVATLLIFMMQVTASSIGQLGFLRDLGL